MKVAILLPGHMRTWEYCRQNFIDNLCDSEHDVDVFVDTYFQQYATYDTPQKEQRWSKNNTDDEIKQAMNDINVIHYNAFQDELPSSTEHERINSQLTKLRQLSNTLKWFEDNNNQVYDIVIRTRFDITLDNKLNYNDINNQLNENEKLLFVGTPSMTYGINDMFCIGRSNLVHKYLNRSQLFLFNTDDNYTFSESIGISIVRRDDDKFVPFKGYAWYTGNVL